MLANNTRKAKKMAWKEVSFSEKNLWDFEQNNILIGTYIERYTNVGPNKSCMYHIALANGEVVAFWGASAIDAKMENVPLNAKVKIEYKGKEKNPKTGRTYKNFSIFYDDDVTAINAELQTEAEKAKEATDPSL